MTSDSNGKLLKNKKAVEEINRHRWIESEKAGHDIGFETASVDWLEKFSAAWMDYHMPKRKVSAGSSIFSKFRKTPSKKTSKRTKASPKTK
ncbi:MAG: hypothetical protein KAR31_03580 [Candidatus Omnitrophica bacterium]|nr:hypothetical protein [Candidatus Omnitrophota bacterium]